MAGKQARGRSQSYLSSVFTAKEAVTNDATQAVRIFR